MAGKHSWLEHGANNTKDVGLILVRVTTSLFFLASLVTQMVKNLSAMQETWVRSRSWEDPLEKEMATHSSILAWRIPWTEEPVGLQSMVLQPVEQDCETTFTFKIVLPPCTALKIVVVIIAECRTWHLGNAR